VSVILNYAVKKRILTYNPCITVDYPMAQEKTRDFYSVEEVKKLLELLRNDGEQNKPYALFFTLAVYTGCRKGEAYVKQKLNLCELSKAPCITKPPNKLQGAFDSSFELNCGAIAR